MENIVVHKKSGPVEGDVFLPASKSISNRVLMIQALCKSNIRIYNLSTANDTLILRNLLEKINNHTTEDVLELDCVDAGTVARFLLSFLALLGKKQYILSGNERLQQRPIGALVDALTELGARIEYLRKKNFLPLRICPVKNIGNTASVTADLSSQFVSSLLLVAPALPQGLNLNILGKVSSRPYIDLTLDIMSGFGIKYSIANDSITIKPQIYKPADITIESDWSSAAFWYQIAALSSNCNIALHGLTKNTKQGDGILSQLFQHLGVASDFENNILCLSKTGCQKTLLEFDFSNYPDVFPSVLLSSTLCSIPARFSGLQNLVHKESDRLRVMLSEMENNKMLGSYVMQNMILQLNNGFVCTDKNIIVDSYNDHRIAMAFASCASQFNEIVIKNADVVNKSYPGFWTDLSKCGFTWEIIN